MVGQEAVKVINTDDGTPVGTDKPSDTRQVA